jgi:hypothetical protein
MKSNALLKNNRKLAASLVGLAVFSFMTISCSDDDSGGGGDSTIVEEWNIVLTGDQEIPSSNRTETGTAHLTLHTDNRLEFEITINGLAASDELTMAHVHTGNPVSNGDVAITVVDGEANVFDRNSASGTIMLTDSQVNVLTGDDIYFNVHSEQVPSGLIRGQMDREIVLASDVFLSSDNEVPPVTGRDATGLALIRLTVDNVLFYKLKIENDLPTDPITMGHIHSGPAGQNGEVLQDLQISQSDFDENGETGSMMVTLNSSISNQIKTTDTYVNLHSTAAPDGIMRGQIDRN